MVPKVLGLTEKSEARPILGFSDTETIKLDFDNASFRTVKYWAFRTMKHFRLDGFLILKSSQKSYHVVFNRVVSWAQNIRVVAWVALLSNSKGLQKFCLMQCIKTSSTLRISRKKEKPCPRIVCRIGEQDQKIKDFLRIRRLIKRIGHKTRENR